MARSWLVTIWLFVSGTMGVARWKEDRETFRQLTHSVEQLADLNRNLEHHYRDLEFGADFSDVVGNMIESLKKVQTKGEEMVEQIKIQEEKLQEIKDEISAKETFSRSIDLKRNEAEELTRKFKEEMKTGEEKKITLQKELEVLEKQKGEMSREVKSIEEVVLVERSNKEKEVARIKKELAEYRDQITEANTVLSEIKLAQEQIQKVPAKESFFPTPEIFIPLLILSVIFNLILGAQALDVRDLLPLISRMLDVDTNNLSSKSDSIAESLIQMAMQLSDKIMANREEEDIYLLETSPYDFDSRMDNEDDMDPVRILKKIKKEKDLTFGKKKSYARKRLGVGVPGNFRD